MSITQFTMEEVRCFGEQQTLEIRPLTFLVGENSTGKTTALACFHVLANFFQSKGVDFNAKPSNSHPYSLGTFKDIVRNSKKKDKLFKLGFASQYANEEVKWTFEFVEKKNGIDPVINSITIELSDGKIIIETEDKTKEIMDMWPLFDSFDEELNQYRITCDKDMLEMFSVLFVLSPFIRQPVEENRFSLFLQQKSTTSKMNRYDLLNIWDTINVFSTSPVRSRPQRTYDPTREFKDPEGSNVPMLLMRFEATQNKLWEELKQQLVEFGKSSGLYQNIEIKNFGRALGTPFQLQFKIHGPKVNIIDVGYGISQILPMLVQIFDPVISYNTSNDSNYFLLQQPEIHLHPRAQAELSSLFAKLASQGNRSFIIETHSDNMIDRARIDIMKGNISPEDVSLIYFEPVKNIVKVHNIGFDEMGNLIGVPTHYRDFFLKESKRLMGFKE